MTMKKIININLSGRVIPIEDSAYEKLQSYIESLRKYFVNEEGRDEIINDIESRIAELLDEKIRKGASSATEADVEEIINLKQKKLLKPKTQTSRVVKRVISKGKIIPILKRKAREDCTVIAATNLLVVFVVELLPI